jgi:DNA-dependent RNA polymerase auxiliary subunit epsilon
VLKKFNDWKISEDESCSDYNIIKFKIGHENKHTPQHNHTGTRYIIKEQNYNKFDKTLIEIVSNKFQVENLEDLDSNLVTYVKEKGDIESP